MLPERHVILQDEICPVPDEVLGKLYRSNPHGLNELIASVPSSLRALLAVYCYRRAHLASIALAIGASCDEDDLTSVGGNVGTVIFKQSREVPPGQQISSGRRKITLATGQIRQLAPFKDEEDLKD